MSKSQQELKSVSGQTEVVFYPLKAASYRINNPIVPYWNMYPIVSSF